MKTVAIVFVAVVAGVDASNPLIPCQWGPALSTDVYGTGIGGGTYERTLRDCQNHCEWTDGCLTAQFSQTQRYNGYNCFIYNTHNDHTPLAYDMESFRLYKCTRSSSPHTDGNWYGPVFKDIYGTGIDGGSSQWTWHDCKNHCRFFGTCKAAQFSPNMEYNGFNCFIYDNQNPTEGQLKNFELWYYNGHNDGWSPGMARDIDGTGMGGSWESNVDRCKARCKASYTCKAAQYAPTGSYKGYNCYIYATDVTNAPQFQNFVLYKYNRGGCHWLDIFCHSRLFSQDEHWVEIGKESSITNLALPLMLAMGAVGAIVGAVRFARARASQRALVAGTENFVDTEGSEMEVIQ